jgi:hypothetical protein
MRNLIGETAGSYQAQQYNTVHSPAHCQQQAGVLFVKLRVLRSPVLFECL